MKYPLQLKKIGRSYIMNKKKFKHKRLFQGMGIGYLTCLSTHILAALLPMYVVFPFAEQLFGSDHGHSCGNVHEYSPGLLNHILGDILTLSMILVPVTLITWLGHKLVKYFKCKCGAAHEEDSCETCPHRKDLA